EAGEIDRLINAELARVKIKSAAKTTDDQFLRRVYLDLTGKLPTPAELGEFVRDRDTNKRARLIDKLLDSPEYARHWGQYWRIVIGIQIQCAQCHDHPSDVWKRHHFHEFAAYFARYRERPILEEKKFTGSSIASLPFGEQLMPDKNDPKTGTKMAPTFLDGK